MVFLFDITSLRSSTDFPRHRNIDKARFLKLTVIEVPYGQTACISGLRIFGVGDGEKPEVPEFEAYRENELDMMVKIAGTNRT